MVFQPDVINYPIHWDYIESVVIKHSLFDSNIKFSSHNPQLLCLIILSCSTLLWSFVIKYLIPLFDPQQLLECYRHSFLGLFHHIENVSLLLDPVSCSVSGCQRQRQMSSRGRQILGKVERSCVRMAALTIGDCQQHNYNYSIKQFIRKQPASWKWQRVHTFSASVHTLEASLNPMHF